jgi:hypothetical protein
MRIAVIKDLTENLFKAHVLIYLKPNLTEADIELLTARAKYYKKVLCLSDQDYDEFDVVSCNHSLSYTFDSISFYGDENYCLPDKCYDIEFYPYFVVTKNKLYCKFPAIIEI